MARKIPESLGSQKIQKHRAPWPRPWALFVFGLLLVLPLWTAVLVSQQLGWQVVAAYSGLISILTYSLYWADKKKATTTQWRIPEAHLHFFELLGGWPAGLLAQRFLRHKTKKKSFQRPFWLIIILHQFIAFEIVSQNAATRTLFALIERAAKSG